MKKQFINPPFLSTSFSEGGKGAKRRFSNILSTRRRKAGAAIVAVALMGTLCLGALVACEKKQSEALNRIPDDQDSGLVTMYMSPSIENAVHGALLEDSDNYADAEFYAEGHVILGIDDEGTEILVYTVTSFGGYSFMNDMFIKDTGSGVIPAVIVLDNFGGMYTPIEIRWPKDGSYYVESIKELFPEEYQDKALSAQDYYDELIEQEHTQAGEYLKSIGRDAEIGDYIDLNAVLPDMDTEASNYFMSIKGTEDFGLANAYMEKFPIWRFPIYQGTHEYIQDGKRYIYETNWEGDKSGGAMHYTVYDENGKITVGYSFMVNGGNVSFGRLERPVEDALDHPVE